MALSWPQRHEQLLSILDIVQGDDEDDRLGLVLDEGKSRPEYPTSFPDPNFLSGKEKKHVAQFKFGDRDVRVIGALDAGQYSTASEVDSWRT